MLLSGREIAENLLTELKHTLETAAPTTPPRLAVILVGEHPASLSYIRMKQKACALIGFESELYQLPSTCLEGQLAQTIETLNKDPLTHGILLQLPLPKHLDPDFFLPLISPQKDVDGFHPLNLGKLVTGCDQGFIPCTPLGIYELLRRAQIPLQGQNIAIVGRSRIVGMPLTLLLGHKKWGNATVVLCHSQTQDLENKLQQADIIVAAIGSPKMIKASMVKEGSVVVDVGINKIDDPSTSKGYRLVGDVDFDAVLPKAKAITPVPGGVGPMTVASLMLNTWKAFKMQCV